jgi:outer membrane lipoprotein-sorting protein
LKLRRRLPQEKAFMRVPLRLVACLAITLAATPAVPRAQGTVDEIVAKALAARGGVETLKGTNSVRMRGKLKAPRAPQEVTIELIAKRPNLVRRDMKMGEVTSLSGYDGTSVWVKQGASPTRILTGAEADQVKQQLEFDSVFLDYKANGHTVELIGTETLNGKPVHHLKVTRKDGLIQDYYLDAETGLEAKMGMSVEQGGLTLRIETEFSDYRNVAGRVVPFMMKNFTNGSSAGEVRFEEIEFNVPLESAMFTPPAAKQD